MNAICSWSLSSSLNFCFSRCQNRIVHRSHNSRNRITVPIPIPLPSSITSEERRLSLPCFFSFFHFKFWMRFDPRITRFLLSLPHIKVVSQIIVELSLSLFLEKGIVSTSLLSPIVYSSPCERRDGCPPSLVFSLHYPSFCLSCLHLPSWVPREIERGSLYPLWPSLLSAPSETIGPLETIVSISHAFFHSPWPMWLHPGKESVVVIRRKTKRRREMVTRNLLFRFIAAVLVQVSLLHYVWFLSE